MASAAEDVICVVCLGTCKNKAFIDNDYCRHAYCYKCICKAARTQMSEGKPATCPLCQKTFTHVIICTRGNRNIRKEILPPRASPRQQEAVPGPSSLRIGVQRSASRSLALLRCNPDADPLIAGSPGCYTPRQKSRQHAIVAAAIKKKKMPKRLSSVRKAKQKGEKQQRSLVAYSSSSSDDDSNECSLDSPHVSSSDDDGAS